jgi:hypothetical protein
MSDDETVYNRTSEVNRYLYGKEQEHVRIGSTGSGLDQAGHDADNSFSSEDENNSKQRSKSQDSTTRVIITSSSPRPVLRSGQMRSKTTEIERRVQWRNVHSMVNSQNDRLLNEKQELNELNQRLDLLVDSLKQKKAQNDELQERIRKYRDEVLGASNDNSPQSKLKRQYKHDLDEAKRELNEVSEMSTMTKIRASRSMYELDRLRQQYDDEMRFQTSEREKIRSLENRRADSLHELNFLKEDLELKQKSLIDDAEKNEKLRAKLKQLNDQLDNEQERRVELQCRIQTMSEKKKFDEELYRIMRGELGKLQLYQGEHSIHDPQTFYNMQLREIKESIRNDFKKMSEFNYEATREEYEYKYAQVVEEMENARKQAEAQREKEDTQTLTQLNVEMKSNQEELNALRANELRLTQMFDELKRKLDNKQHENQSALSIKENERLSLEEQVNGLKSDLISMLNCSKSLDAEVAVYARLLNQRFTSPSTTTTTTTTTVEINNNANNVVISAGDAGGASTFSYERYGHTILQPNKVDEQTARAEQEELRRKALEVEETNRRLKELELERERQRRLAEEEHRRQRELDEELRRQRELEEQKRKQRELDEQMRRQREFEEKQRRQRELQQQQEEQLRIERELELKRQREFELQRQRDLEERRKREQEQEEQQQQRRLREIEEQKRRQIEIEERKRQLELEERRKLAELEEQRRIQRELDEQKRLQREREEQQRRLRVQEEQERLKQQQQLEEQMRIKREYELQLELEERERRIKQQQQQQELERLRRQQEFEQQQHLLHQQQIIEQQKRHKDLEEDRQRRLQLERDEREKYIIEKLRQEQELIEIQKRKKLIQEQQDLEQQPQAQKHQIQVNYQQTNVHQGSQKQPIPVQRQIKCVDNIQSVTKHIVEEKHKSTDIYECIEHIPVTINTNINSNWQKKAENGHIENVEKQINIKLMPVPNNEKKSTSHHEVRITNNNNNNNTNYQSNIVDHCLSSNNGHKHVLIVNNYNPKSTVRISTSRSPSPPKMRTSVRNTNAELIALQHQQQQQQPSEVQTRNETNKYAIKHKANRYVSGAIGILETSLNGEYIILENLSSNKSVNLKHWYIHRYVPDQNINVIFKFTQDTILSSGEKLKILSKNCSPKINNKSKSMHDGLNHVHTSSSSDEKILVASNVDNWGTYSKFSVTKLINPEGVDKAVLTQSLLRLASSSSNVNALGPGDLIRSAAPHQQQQQVQNGNNHLNVRLVKNSNQPMQRPQTETTTTTTTTTTTKSASSHHIRSTSNNNNNKHQSPIHVSHYSTPIQSSSSANVHVTRQF